jgi:hypothetical protein
MKQADLNDAEWRSLQELRKGPIRHQITLEHEHKLLMLGYAKYMLTGLMVTDIGRRVHRAPALLGRSAAQPLLTLVPPRH